MSTTGTVEGGTFRFRAAHFEWLLRFGAALGLRFDDMGKRRHGDPSTLFFCDELFRLYGSDDYNEAMGASFAVENWAAAGFWKELIAGLERVKAERVPALPLAFFTWHDKLEANHRDHVWHELRACYDAPSFEDEAFIAAGVDDAGRGADVLGRPVRSAAQDAAGFSRLCRALSLSIRAPVWCHSAPQGRGRVNPYRPPGGHRAGEQYRRDEQHRRADEQNLFPDISYSGSALIGIQGGKRTSHCERPRRAEDRVRDDQDVPSRRTLFTFGAERHPDPDLLRHRASIA